MSTSVQTIEELANQEYKYGFVTSVEGDQIPPGGTVKLTSPGHMRAS